jgi:hypothetical protein
MKTILEWHHNLQFFVFASLSLRYTHMEVKSETQRKGPINKSKKWIKLHLLNIGFDPLSHTKLYNFAVEWTSLNIPGIYR